MSKNCFILNLGIICYLFSVYWFINGFLSQDWCLNDSLFDDGLRNHFSCYNRLSKNFLFDNRLRDSFLCLGNIRSWVINFTGVLWLYLPWFDSLDSSSFCLVFCLINCLSAWWLNNFHFTISNHFLKFFFSNRFYILLGSKFYRNKQGDQFKFHLLDEEILFKFGFFR